MNISKDTADSATDLRLSELKTASETLNTNLEAGGRDELKLNYAKGQALLSFAQVARASRKKGFYRDAPKDIVDKVFTGLFKFLTDNNLFTLQEIADAVASGRLDTVEKWVQDPPVLPENILATISAVDNIRHAAIAKADSLMTIEL